MKARIKATGEIVEVTRIVDRYVMTHHPHTITFEKDELDFDIEDEPDYWTRLEHQYAGMAMQGIITNPIGFENIRARANGNLADEVAQLANEYAHALIQKLKEKEERK